jgi:hypothetical protein
MPRERVIKDKDQTVSGKKLAQARGYLTCEQTISINNEIRNYWAEKVKPLSSGSQEYYLPCV